MSILIFHLLTTSFMLGLIWFVQINHYPLMNFVGEKAFVEYERIHMRKTGYVVGPVMLLEASTGAWLLYSNPFTSLSQTTLFAASMALLGAIWLSTFLIQSRQHLKLCEGFSSTLIADLVRGNWIRTALWTGRAGLVALVLWLGQV